MNDVESRRVGSDLVPPPPPQCLRATFLVICFLGLNLKETEDCSTTENPWDGGGGGLPIFWGRDARHKILMEPLGGD